MRAVLISAFLAAALWFALAAAPEPPSNAKQSRADPVRVEPVRLEPVRRDLRDVTPPDMVRTPRPEAGSVARLPAVAPPEPAKRPPRRLALTRPVVLSAGEIAAGEMQIRLSGVEALAADARCGEENGEVWPCGAFGRTALQRLLRARTIECEAHEDARLPSPSHTHCSVGGRDIGGWLVEQGWARATAADYREAEAKARAGKRGQWGAGPAPLQAGASPD